MWQRRVAVEHLTHGLAADDRDSLLDIGLCEWMDAELPDEVFGPRP